jgi:hypothetical protein
LEVQQGFALIPEVFQTVIIPLVGGEEVDDYVAKISYQPAITGLAFNLAILVKFVFDLLNNSLHQAVQHAVAGAGTNNEVVGKRCDIMDVQKEDVFSLFFL